MFQTIKKIAVWGDSILRGTILDEIKKRYTTLAEGCTALVQKEIGVPVLNRSKFGSTVERGLSEFERSLGPSGGLVPDADLIVLEYGGNDCDHDWTAISADPDGKHSPKTPLDVFTRTYQRMIDLVRERGVRPVVMSLPPIDPERYFEWFTRQTSSRGPLNKENILRWLGDLSLIYRFQEMYSLAATKLAHFNGCIYIAMREAFLLEHDYTRLLCADGIHPNQKGHDLMKRVFLNTAEELA